MKRHILCICLAVAVAAVGLLFVPMKAEALSLQSTMSSDKAMPEDTVTVTVSLSAPVTVKSGAVSVSYPTDALELVSGTWLLEGAIVDYDLSTDKGVLVFENEQEISGDVLQLVFNVRETAAEGTTAVTCVPQLLDAAGEAVACEQTVGELQVMLAPGTMNSIASVYQYVSGGVDNSSIGGLAKENSAVYTYNGTVRTAFRIPATYQTDSEDFSTIVLEGESYPILERGIILGTPGMELSMDSGVKVSTKSGFNAKYWEYDAQTGVVTYTVLVKNVTKAKKDVNYIARSYVRIERDGKEYVVYSPVSAAFSPQKLYDGTAKIFESQGKKAPAWFVNSSIDDGIIDLS